MLQGKLRQSNRALQVSQLEGLGWRVEGLGVKGLGFRV